ncbi:MAG: pseudouridine synthase [Deltaproteobacteria bacterium]|nr:MAG: pseudouridine synthase [Deltaproteobacteria bacterium]
MNNHSPQRVSAPPSHDPKTIRINKAIAQAGYCSRRKADELVSQGRVTVNGKVVTLPGLRIAPSKDVITVDGSRLPRPGSHSATYLLLYKPRGTVTTAHDPQGRKTVLDLLPKQYREQRVFPVGRLDIASEGLLVLTTDGALTQKMTHPGYNHPKTYEVIVLGVVTQAMLGQMRQGMTLAEGERLRPVEVTILRTTRTQTILTMILRQGINRQIRRMCRDLGLKVLRLKRTRQGPLCLGDLKPGAFRELTRDEVGRLKKSLQRKKTPFSR